MTGISVTDYLIAEAVRKDRERIVAAVKGIDPIEWALLGSDMAHVVVEIVNDQPNPASMPPQVTQ